jgi:hypothetical protein
MLKKESTFAMVKFTRVWQERLGDISEADAKAEGGYGRKEYIDGVIEMHGGKIDEDSVLWCYEFERIVMQSGCENTPLTQKEVDEMRAHYGDDWDA